jgi:hypothetical protein
MSAEFPARFSGPCAQGDRVVPGELIRYTDDNRIEHVECPDPTAVADTDRPWRFEGTSVEDRGY